MARRSASTKRPTSPGSPSILTVTGLRGASVSSVPADVVFSDAILHRADAVIGSDCDPRGDGDERCPIHSIEIREDDEFPFVYIEGISRVFV